MTALIFAGIFTGVVAGLRWKFKKWLNKPPPVEDEPTNQEIRQSPEYRQWRNQIYDRDTWCIFCHSLDTLEAHHIYSFAAFPELRFEPTNGILLCQKCHKLTPNYGYKQKQFDQQLSQNR